VASCAWISSSVGSHPASLRGWKRHITRDPRRCGKGYALQQHGFLRSALRCCVTSIAGPAQRGQGWSPLRATVKRLWHFLEEHLSCRRNLVVLRLFISSWRRGP